LIGMERLLLLLPSRPQPIIVRYGITTAIVVVLFLLQVGLYSYSGFIGLFLMMPGIFLAGVMFDRGSGFYASLLSVVLTSWFFLRDWLFLDSQSIALILFFLVGLGLAAASEALRKALEKSQAAERHNELMFRELMHRTRNNLASVSSLLRLQARASTTPETRGALDAAAGRVQVMTDVHEFLRNPGPSGTVDMSDYLEELCRKLGDALRGARPVAVEVSAEHVELSRERAEAIGLIVNELVTNSLKYAFPDGRPGLIAVTLRQDGEIVLLVEDNGIGCPTEIKEGLGSRLIQLMAQQLRGEITREAIDPGCRVMLRLKK